MFSLVTVYSSKLNDEWIKYNMYMDGCEQAKED